MEGRERGARGSRDCERGAQLFVAREVHLAEAIESLLGQTYSDFRLVLLDDASVDQTEALSREYALAVARSVKPRSVLRAAE